LKVIPISDEATPFLYMARCSKCDIDKEASEYYTYYHSTQKKYRTRKVCNSCFKGQKSIYRESIKKEKIIQPTPIQIPFTPTPTPEPEFEYRKETRGRKPLGDNSVFIGMEDKVCYTCKIEKPATDFYIHRRTLKLFTSCKQCELDKEKKEYQQYIEENGGSDRVRRYPGQWEDKYQQENVEGFLKLIGWKHNGEHWYKDGVRSGEDGVWEKMRGMKKYRRPNSRKKGSPVKDRLNQQIEEIIQRQKNGASYPELCDIYKVSTPTIRQVIEEYYEKK
jgi:hypothetical protein